MPRKGMIAVVVGAQIFVRLPLKSGKPGPKAYVLVQPIEDLRGILAADREGGPKTKAVARCLSCARDFATVDMLLDGHDHVEIEREGQSHLYALAVDKTNDDGNVTETRLFEPRRLR